ncbi:hypothetical protein [Streptomyces sp. NPDC057238]|uniref:hypothetical protein n=1 Tax=Streptomyces sp. NPDC057238 TaxID=3346060 RepID=UPI0036316D6F
MSERGDGEARGHAETWGRASGGGQVNQAGADQYVIHVHVPEDRDRTDDEWAARCRELEEQVRNARAEGRAEARAEFAKRLRDAELRAVRAERIMREAEEKRARAEEMLARARQEPDSRRQTAEREQETASVRDSAGPAQDGEGVEETGVPLVDALAAGGVMFREQLRRLGMVTGRRDGRGTAPRIVDGEGAEKSDPVGERTFTPPTCDRPDPDPAP